MGFVVVDLTDEVIALPLDKDGQEVIALPVDKDGQELVEEVNPPLVSAHHLLEGPHAFLV